MLSVAVGERFLGKAAAAATDAGVYSLSRQVLLESNGGCGLPATRGAITTQMQILSASATR